jgi:hypothetical protein
MTRIIFLKTIAVTANNPVNLKIQNIRIYIIKKIIKNHLNIQISNFNIKMEEI